MLIKISFKFVHTGLINNQGRSVVVVDVEAQSKIHSINIVTWAYSPGNYLLDFSITGYQYKDFVLKV